jgi:dynein light chain 4
MAAASQTAVDFKDLPEAEYRKIIAKPIVPACDMVPSEMSNEATEIITMAVDKYVTNGPRPASRDSAEGLPPSAPPPPARPARPSVCVCVCVCVFDCLRARFVVPFSCTYCSPPRAGNYEAMSKMIKEAMDKKYGPQWHCAIGEGFGFDITYQQPNMIYVYYGKIGILLYKC